MSEIFHPIPRSHFQELASISEPHCVSIYIPMFRGGKEQNQGLSEAHLKNCIREVHQSLQSQGMDGRQVPKYLKPVKQLLADMHIWRNPADGMAIFLSSSLGMEFYRLPFKFEVSSYVSEHFYLLPLLPMYEIEFNFYLLELSQDYVKLFEGNQFELQDLFVNEFAPERLEEAVGFDYEQKMLQFRSGHSVYSSGSFHGQGEGKDDDGKEIAFFFREINKGVNITLKDKNAPLILACVDWLYPLYREVNTYPNLHPIHLGGDPQFKNKRELHDAAYTLVSDIQDKNREQKVNRYQELVHTAKTSHQVSEIVPAAANGRVDTLFVRKGDDIFGTYNKNKDCVIIDSEKTNKNLSLLNLAALNTHLKSGSVHIMEAEDMPFKKKPLNALFRY